MPESNDHEELDAHVADVVAHAGADYVHAEQLVDRLMASIDAREETDAAAPPAAEPPVPLRLPALRTPPRAAERTRRSPGRRHALFGLAAVASVAATIALVIAATPRHQVATAQGWTGRVAQVVRAVMTRRAASALHVELPADPDRREKAEVGPQTDARTRSRIELSDKTEMSRRDTEYSSRGEHAPNGPPPSRHRRRDVAHSRTRRIRFALRTPASR